MPSASNKQESKSPPEVSEPLKQVVTAVEKKIRNLEKRKTKLDNYRKDESSGKTLNAEQKQAVSRYEEVTSQLELARDFIKQFQVIGIDTAKLQRKQVKREQAERAQQETAKLKQLLLIQDVLNNMGGECVREDFLEGKNGAAKLSEESLNRLDELYKLLSPSREESGEKFEEDVVAASEHFHALIEGKDKKVIGTTYRELKSVLDSINQCCYFGGTPTVEEIPEAVTEEPHDEFQDARETLESRSSNGPTDEAGDEATGGQTTPQEQLRDDTEETLIAAAAEVSEEQEPPPAPQPIDDAGICFLQDSQIQSAQEDPSSHPIMPSPRAVTPVPQELPISTELESSSSLSSAMQQPFSQTSPLQPSQEGLEASIPPEPEEEIKDDLDMGTWQEVPSATYTNSNTGGFRNYKGRGGPREGRGGRGMTNGYGGKPQRQPYQNGRGGGYSGFQSREGGGGGGNYRGDYRRDGPPRGGRGGGRGGPRGGRGGDRPRGGRGGGYQQQSRQ